MTTELTPKLKRAYRWKADYLSDKVGFTIRVLQSLTEPVVADLVRRGEQWNDPDGYPPGTGDGTGRSSDIFKSTTASAALSGLPDKAYDEYGVKIPDDWNHRQRERDVIGEALDQLFSSLVEMSGHARIIEKKHLVVAKADEKLRGRVHDFEQCRACHRDVACTSADPIRSGYCSACSTRWYAWWNEYKHLVGANKPLEMQRFEAQRPKHDDHNELACLLCADPVYKKAKAS